MKIEKKQVNVKSGCDTDACVDEKDVKSGTECADSKDCVDGVEDINDVGDTPEENVEAKKNLGLAKQFYALASNHVQNAIDALGDAASSGDKYAKQEIADLSVILMDLKNLGRMG